MTLGQRTASLRAWRVSAAFRSVRALCLTKVSRESRVCQNRSGLAAAPQASRLKSLSIGLTLGLSATNKGHPMRRRSSMRRQVGQQPETRSPLTTTPRPRGLLWQLWSRRDWTQETQTQLYHQTSSASLSKKGLLLQQQHREKSMLSPPLTPSSPRTMPLLYPSNPSPTQPQQQQQYQQPITPNNNKSNNNSSSTPFSSPRKPLGFSSRCDMKSLLKDRFPEGDQTWADVKRQALLEYRKNSYKGRDRQRRGPEERVKRFLKLSKTAHDLQVLSNRGLYIPGLANERQNLGNLLHISEKYIKDLDMDPNQGTLPPPSAPVGWTLQGSLRPLQVYTFTSSPPDHPSLVRIFDDAISLVQSLFSAKQIDMDLKMGCLEDDFTVDVLVDCYTGQVLAVAEYVFMRKYVWVECLAVHPGFQRFGLGQLMMERVKAIATYRSKTLLLFALMDVVDFYTSAGLGLSLACMCFPGLLLIFYYRLLIGNSIDPHKEWHIGKFMEWAPS